MIESHPFQEYNEHGYLCHYPGCRTPSNEHAEFIDKAKPGAASAAPGCKRNPSVAGSSFAFALASRGLAAITGNPCCGGNGVEASCEECRRG